MYNSRLSVGSQARKTSQFRSSLGNTATRYNSEVTNQRKKYLINTSRNSEDAPEWMSRTQNFHHREHNRNRSMFSNATSGFKHIEQTYVYANTPKRYNPEGQFERLVKPRNRTKWEMKSHTFEFQWPKSQAQVKAAKSSSVAQSQLGQYETAAAPRPSSRPNNKTRFEMAKYGYAESPLHQQRDTPLKIGHPQMVNTTYVW